MAVGGELVNHVFVQQTTKLSEHIKVTRYLFIRQLYSFNIKAKWSHCVTSGNGCAGRCYRAACTVWYSKSVSWWRERNQQRKQPWVWVATPHETSCKPLTPVCSTIIQSVVDMCAPSRCFYQSWIYKPNTLTESQRQWWCVIVVTLTVDQSFPQSLVQMVKRHMVFVFLLVNSDFLSWWVGGAKSLFKNHVLYSVKFILV